MLSARPSRLARSLRAVLLYSSFARGETAHASPAPELLSALPAGAPTLVYLDLAAMRASSFYQHRPDKGPIAVPNQDYADFVRSTGFDFEKDLDRVVVASWPAPSGKEPKKNVVIAEGRFDRAKIRDYAAQKGKLDHQQGREVFLFPAERPDGNEFHHFPGRSSHRPRQRAEHRSALRGEFRRSRRAIPPASGPRAWTAPPCS